MRTVTIALCCLAGVSQALAEPCPGNPDAIGTSRTVVVDGSKLPLIGKMHYETSVPLEDHEVLLTFDDGPRPPYTDRILEALAHECVKATFFEVGYMVRANPQTTRRVYNAGHSIGSHSQNHPVTFGHLGLPGIESEVGGGFATIAAALGDPRAVSTFFRAPGLAQNRTLNPYLAARATSLWSTDTHAWDWSGISAAEIIRRTLAMLDAKGGRGVVLLHDLQPATALAMPELLKTLKARGYKIVHAIAPGERPKTVPEPNGAAPLVADYGWPRTLSTSTVESETSTVESEKASDERRVPLLADGDGALALTGSGAVNAGMKPALPDWKHAAPPGREPHAANTLPARKPVWLTRGTAPRKKPDPIPASWTLLGRT
jgi:peptidoglycan/xylan/chitin deacetylase (PgdA/CDA1 family)